MVQVVEDRVELLRHVLPHGAVCAEVGVCEGVFARHIAMITAPRRLHLIDVWAKIPLGDCWAPSDEQSLDRLRAVSALFHEGVKAGRVFLHQGLSGEILSAFRDGYFDWVYVDGDHRYPGCLADLRAADRKTKMYIAGHDYCDEWPGVVRAVTEFCDQERWGIVAMTKAGIREGNDPDGRLSPSYVLARKL